MTDLGYEEMDLFAILGVERPEQEKQPEKEKQRAKKEKSAKKAEEAYDSPYTIYSGCYEPLTVHAPENQKLSRKILIEKWQDEHPEYTSNLLDFTAEKSHGYACFQEKRALSKGTVRLNKKTRLIYGGHVYDLSGAMTDLECEADLSALQKLVAEETPEFGENAAFYYDADNNVLIPKPESQADFSAIKVQNIILHVIGREQITLSLKEYASLSDEKIESDEKGFFSPNRSKIEAIVKERYPEFTGRMRIGFYKAGGAYVVTMHAPAPKTAKNTITYPTNAKISLIFTKLDLSPELFGGKEYVTEAEIIRYLSKDYPEYTKERTRIEYDKEENLIIPVLKGSTKGALISAAEQSAHEARGYRLEHLKDFRQTRHEMLPFADFRVSKASSFGEIVYYLPKIPGNIYGKAEAFFGYIAKKYGTEAMLQLFWNRNEREYELHCPIQRCSYTNVTCERDHDRESRQWLIMDLHSHGTINCSFSGVDDEDETGTRLYGVFYGYHAGGYPKFDLRAGCGGHHFPLRKENFFTTESHFSYREFDFSEWERRLMPEWQ